MAVVGMAVGAAPLAFNLFQEIVHSFEVFEATRNAGENCDAYGLDLKMQHARLHAWAAITGLGDQKSHHLYDRKMIDQRDLVFAILGELERVLRGLRESDLRYQDKSVEPAGDVEEQSPIVEAPMVKPKQRDISDPPVVEGRKFDPGDFTMPEVIEPNPTDIDLTDTEWDQYEKLSAIQTDSSPFGFRIAPRGLNHAFGWLKSVAKGPKEPEGICWAVSDIKKFENNLNRVKELVEYLVQTLSDDQMQRYAEASYENNLLLLQFTGNFNELKALQQAVEGTRSLSGSTQILKGGRADSGIQIDQEVELRFQASFAKLISFSLAANGVGESGPNNDMKIKSEDRHLLAITEEVDAGRRALGNLQDHGRVWIEWKPYSPVDLENRSADEAVTRRVESLAALLAMEKPDEFCVPSCIRYFVDTEAEKFGLVFRMPDGAAEGSLPQSLLAMLESSCRVGLQSRINIAQQIAHSLVHLHAVNWLHKDLRSASILFFATEGAKSLGKVYISGFDYARVLQRGDVAGGLPYEAERALYQHPDYLDPENRPQFCKIYDIYALGIVLIELACWKRIDDIVSIEMEPRIVDGDHTHTQENASESEDDDDFRKLVQKADEPKRSMTAIRSIRSKILDPAEGIFDRVEAAMGGRYRSAVYACIKGMEAFGLPKNKDQANPVIGGLLHQAFLRKVIDPLMSIQV